MRLLRPDTFERGQDFALQLVRLQDEQPGSPEQLQPGGEEAAALELGIVEFEQAPRALFLIVGDQRLGEVEEGVEVFGFGLDRGDPVVFEARRGARGPVFFDHCVVSCRADPIRGVTGGEGCTGMDEGHQDDLARLLREGDEAALDELLTARIEEI